MIRNFLLKSGVVTAEEIKHYQQAAHAKGEPLWEPLLRDNKITEAWLADVLAQYLHLPIVGLGGILVDSESAHRIPESLARKHACIPIAMDASKLKVAFVDPSNLASVQAVEFFTGIKVQPLVGVRTQVLEAIDEHYSRAQALDVIDQAGEVPELQMIRLGEEIDLDGADSLKASNIPPIIKLVNMIMAEALRGDASDIHLEPAEHEIHVRMRVDGVLREFIRAPAWLHAGVCARLKVLSKLDITEKRLPQDGRFKVRYKSRITDVRVSTLPSQFGEKVVLRVLGSSEGIPAPGRLGIPADDLPAVVAAVKQPQGMIIVTGPTGSGKTTTLYSLLNYNRSSEVNIVTVEDPIEYQLKGATQVAVNPKVGLTFAACLRSILRQDPDTILVGEVRDYETAEIAFHAAMTGHLVLTSLHTNHAIATVLRLLDLGINPFLITSSVTLVVAQRLVRVICDHCRDRDRPSARILQQLRWDDPGFVFSRGTGCKVCQGTGYKGRIGIYEILRLSPAVREAIQQGASEAVIRKAAVKDGMVPLLEAARDKIRQGVTTPEEVLRVIQLEDTEKIVRPRPEMPAGAPKEALASVEDQPLAVCASCSQTVEPNWKVCPQCACPVNQPPTDAPTKVESDPAALNISAKVNRTLQ